MRADICLFLGLGLQPVNYHRIRWEGISHVLYANQSIAFSGLLPVFCENETREISQSTSIDVILRIRALNLPEWKGDRPVTKIVQVDILPKIRIHNLLE